MQATRTNCYAIVYGEFLVTNNLSSCHAGAKHRFVRRVPETGDWPSSRAVDAALVAAPRWSPQTWEFSKMELR